jgi:hypothetical protein
VNGRDLLDRLRDLGLPAGHFAVFGSGPLLVRGIIDDVGDLDVLVKRTAWERVGRMGTLVEIEEGVMIVSLDDGALTFGRSWAYGDFDIDELIDTADVIEGLPFVRLEHVIAFKQAANRPKDREHLTLLAAWSGS